MKIYSAVLVTASLVSCTSTTRIDQTKLSADGEALLGQNQAKLNTGEAVIGQSTPGGNQQTKLLRETGVAGQPAAFDMQTEAIVSRECVEAWRKALKGDEQGSISQLKDLEKRYPNVSTIKLMMGQCLEHLGKRQEAIEYYRKALENSEFSSIRVFKLAEALRRSGKYSEAATHYRKLIKTAPNFADGKLGLAISLRQQDKNSEEAKKLFSETVKLAGEELKSGDPQQIADAKRILSSVLSEDPGNKEAQSLLSR
ncbi:MAG TPA: tetratricopeptide repeat protein [Candidatus Obscuribacterales bacterium]